MFWVTFLVVALGFTIYTLSYQDPLSICTDFRQVKIENLLLHSSIYPLFFILLFLYILPLFMLHTHKYIALSITLYNIMSLKEVERRKTNKYSFIEFVILTILLSLAGFLYFFLQSSVTTCFNFFTPVKLCFYLSPFCYYYQIYYISI